MDTTTDPTPSDPGASDPDPGSGAVPGPDDPRSHVAGAVIVAAGVIDGVRDDQLDRPTPCGDMAVRDLLEHLVMVLRRVARAGEGVPVAQWPVDAADVRDGGWLDAWRSAAHEVQAAWTDDALLERPTELPWGTFPGAEVLGVYTNEIVVHTWDLARATGQHPDWDPTVLEAALAAIHQQLPMAERAPMWAAFEEQLPPEVPWEDPFGDAVDVDDDAPLIDRLVAWNGRDPR